MKKKKASIVIYTDKRGNVEFRADIERETLWASLNQVAALFGVQKSAVSKHFQNIFDSGELSRTATVSVLETVQKEGKRAIYRKIEQYNLDAIIAVGYRVNSKRATAFRIWATKTLREYLTKGYVLNEKRLVETNAKVAELQKAINFITSVRDKKLSSDEAQGLLTIIRQYSDTWTTLEAYDSGVITKRASKKKAAAMTIEEARLMLAELKLNLARKGEASELFAQERGHALESLIGAVNQSFGGRELYPSVEEKAAHLLYFVIKDHPFSDGNKRSGAFLFITFLQKSRALYHSSGQAKISDVALTALSLLIAESKPEEKEQMIALITQLLK